METICRFFLLVPQVAKTPFYIHCGTHWQIRELSASFKAPRPIEIATESPFNEENDGAYLRCKIWRFLVVTVPPYENNRHFTLKIPVIAPK